MNIIAPICQTGYGIAAANIVNAAIKKGIRTSLFPLGGVTCEQEYAENIQLALNNAQYFDDSPCVRIWHQFDMSMFVGRGKKVGFPIFELDKFTSVEKYHLSSLDHIFVCSEWAKQVILNNGIKVPTSVVPLGTDAALFSPTISKYQPTVFLNVGKWEKRKGHDVLLEAFNRAFDLNDDVMLWMMCNNMFFTPEQNNYWVNKFKNSPLGNKISILPPQNSQAEVAAIMQKADCGVFPARAEGWNLEIPEMMACGKHIITTNYSGHTEYCNPYNSMLLDTVDTEPAVGLPGLDDRWFFGQGNWVKITDEHIDQMADYMRAVHQLKQDGKLDMNQNGIETAKKLSWENTVDTMMEQL